MVSIGDSVVYRHHVCEVTDIKEAYYEGKDYLELHALFENHLKLYITVESAQPPALRPVMSRKEALALIDSIGQAETPNAETLKKNSETPVLLDRRIKAEYDKRLKTFTPEELLPIMKFAYERSQRRAENGRNATATDKKYFNLAENLLCNELSVSLDIDRDDVNNFLVDRIEKAVAKKRSFLKRKK